MNEFYVILHNIRSCYNVGSIFRSADAFGARKIFLGGYTPTPETNSKEIAKTALGAEKFVFWKKRKRTGELIMELKKQGVKIVALEQDKSSVGIKDLKTKSPIALVLGNEIRGLSEAMLNKADQIVEIPMIGKKESLNVSVAFGIAAHSISKK